MPIRRLLDGQIQTCHLRGTKKWSMRLGECFAVFQWYGIASAVRSSLCLCSLFWYTILSLLLEGGYKVDVVFTSRLKRAIRSTWLLLKEMNEVYLPVFKSWRLNERMYGALTGLSKSETAERLGAELVQEWWVEYLRLEHCVYFSSRWEDLSLTLCFRSSIIGEDHSVHVHHHCLPQIRSTLDEIDDTLTYLLNKYH